MSSRPSAFDALRQAPGGVGASGNPTFEWRLTNTRLRDPVRIVVQDRILPVIFVPGIMGSNLMDLGGAPVWRLDTGLGGVPWSLVRNVAPMGPGRRQRAMHPDRTQVDPNGRVPHDAVGTINGRTRRDREAIYRERFWGARAAAANASAPGRTGDGGPGHGVWHERTPHGRIDVR